MHTDRESVLGALTTVDIFLFRYLGSLVHASF